MELTVREAATLMGRSARTVRAQLARGELKGTRRSGRWHVQAEHLPLTAEQQKALQNRADSVRQAVDAVLPSRTASYKGQRRRSLVDLDAFRHGAEVLAQLRADSASDEITSRLEAALLSVAEAHYQYTPRLKRLALEKARAGMATTVGLLLLSGAGAPDHPHHAAMETLEASAIPALAGLARWVERMEQRR